MLNLNYNIKGRSRSILIIVTLLGGFFSVFYYTVLFPDSRFNIDAINYSVTALYFLLFFVVYFVHDQQKINRIEELYTASAIAIFLYNCLVVLSAEDPQSYLSVLILLVASLSLSIDRYLLQKIFLFFSSAIFVGAYCVLTPDQPYFVVLYFMFVAMLGAYIFLAKRAIARVSTLSLNFERFINNELSGYVFLDTKKKKWIYQNDKAKQLWSEQSIDFLLKVSQEKTLEEGKLRFSVILKKKNHTIYRIDDITKERNSIESYNHIFQKNLAGVYETMLDGTIIVANDSFAKIFGYESKEEIIDVNVSKFYKNPKDREAFLEHIKQEKFLTNFEAEQIDKNGKEFYVLNNIVYNEDKHSLSGIIIDITAKKEHEKKLIEEKEKSQIAFDEGTLKLKAIFEGLKNAQVYTLDKSFNVVSINETARSAYIAYGGTKLEAGVSYIWYWETCFEPEYIERLKELITRAFKGESQYIIGKFNTKNGERWIESYINPIYSTKGSIKEVSIISNDITEKQEYEKKLKDSIDEKDIILREVHHRVKNNLQVISSILSLQSNYVEDQNILNILAESQNRIKTMSFIHESLYQTKNFVEIRFKEHLEKLINNLIYSYSVEKNKIQIESDIEDLGLELDLAIPLGLIMNEIISNSLKHAFVGRDRGEILIQMKKKDDKIELLIQDDGVGMDPDMNIYDSNTLGLQLIITLVDQIDGTISIENSEGTKFLIIFAP